MLPIGAGKAIAFTLRHLWEAGGSSTLSPFIFKLAEDSEKSVSNRYYLAKRLNVRSLFYFYSEIARSAEC